MTLKELGKFKLTILSEFAKSKEIVDLLLPDHTEDDDIDAQLFGDESTNGCMFKWEYVPDTQEETRSFLCVETEVTKVPSTASYNISVYVFAFCNKKIMDASDKTMYGTRADLLSHYVDSILNGSEKFGIGRLNLVDVAVYKPNNRYYGRVLTYECSGFNNPTGIKKVNGFKRV